MIDSDRIAQLERFGAGIWRSKKWGTKLGEFTYEWTVQIIQGRPLPIIQPTRNTLREAIDAALDRV